MVRLLTRLAEFFGFKPRKKKEGSRLPEFNHANQGMDDKVLKVIADLGGPRRSGHSRDKKGQRIFDRR